MSACCVASWRAPSNVIYAWQQSFLGAAMVTAASIRRSPAELVPAAVNATTNAIRCMATPCVSSGYNTSIRREGAMEYFAEGSPETIIDRRRASDLLDHLVDRWRSSGPLNRVLIIPPDMTRLHSGAGELTCLLFEKLEPTARVDVLPALGTHRPMTGQEIAEMFPAVPADRFFEHNWRTDVKPIGTIPESYVRDVSEGRVSYPIEVAVNRRLTDGGYDRVVSIGQLVPHEVVGIANHNKNIFVGVGGSDLIGKSHYLGAVYGMERLMGRAWSPVRAVLDYASARFANALPITYLLTVRSNGPDGALATRGLFAGDGFECFRAGAELCRRVNLDRLDRAPKTVVVYLDPKEFQSTWLGNKAIYRTRMAIADGGELIVLAPAVREFGERPDIDAMIRAFGYRGSDAIIAAVRERPELADNLAAAGHLIHGSTEGRFSVRYCPGFLSREEIEGVGYRWGDIGEMTRRYPPDRLRAGWNSLDGEEVFFVPNPALGLWGTAERFGDGREA
jgi:nickel-dependent lactate racemase